MVTQTPKRQRHIVTLTMNPALDVSTSTPEVVGEHKMRCGATRLDPGGGGMNVSRVIHRLGGHSVAIYALGGPTGQAYRQLLVAEGIIGRTIPIAESTRENFTVDETSTGKQFRFVLQGPTLTEPEWQACLDALEQSIQPGGFVVASGSLPPGVPDDFYARVARLARELGARCVVDTSGPALGAALDEGVFLIKPSRRELAEFTGLALDTDEGQVEAATRLVAGGKVEYVALTLGGDGAVLAGPDGVSRLTVPRVEVRSTVGAGDSFLGAMVLRLAQRRTMVTAFRSAVAAGSATAMEAGTDLCRPDSVARLEKQIKAGGAIGTGSGAEAGAGAIG